MRSTSRRTFLRGAARAAVGGVAFTATSSKSTVSAAAVAPFLPLPMQPLNIGTWGHSAFPGMTMLHDGSLRLVFREGSDHVASRDGRIIIAESHDGGQTWQNPQVIRQGGDSRDAFLASINGGEYLTLFTGSAANPGLGATVQRMWGSERRIDTLAIGAISAPVVKLPAGSPHGMTYAAMVETSPGTIRLVVGLEQADGSSDLWGGEVIVPSA